MTNTPLNPDALEVALARFAEAVREVEVKFADDGTRPGDYWTGYRAAKNEIADLLAEPKLIKKATRVALAPAQPEVSSVEELDQLPDGSIVKDLEDEVYIITPYDEFWRVWGNDKRFSSGAIVLPARVLYRPTKESE